MSSQNCLLLYPKGVYELLGVSNTKLWELRQRDDFPKPRNVDGKTVMFLRKEIEEWASAIPQGE